VHEDSVSHIICFDSSIGSEPDSLSRKFKFVHLGWVDNDDAIATALSAADLFVMPSIAETFGMMAIESMACGTPVIVFEGTSLPEVVRSPHAGVAVPLGDSGALANVIQVVLQDRLRRQSLVENGLELVAREYKQETYIQRHLDLYNSLLDGQQFGNRRAND
jgi:glycosyltransferase involved in cell wall biosynthesis